MSRCSLSNSSPKQLQLTLKSCVPLQKGFLSPSVIGANKNPAGLGFFSPFYQPQVYFNPPWLEVDSFGEGAAVG